MQNFRGASNGEPRDIGPWMDWRTANTLRAGPRRGQPAPAPARPAGSSAARVSRYTRPFNQADRDAALDRAIALSHRNRDRRERREALSVLGQGALDLLPINPLEPIESLRDKLGEEGLNVLARQAVRGVTMEGPAALPVWLHELLVHYAKEHDMGAEVSNASLPWSRYRYNPFFDGSQ